MALEVSLSIKGFFVLFFRLSEGRRKTEFRRLKEACYIPFLNLKLLWKLF